MKGCERRLSSCEKGDSETITAPLEDEESDDSVLFNDAFDPIKNVLC